MPERYQCEYMPNHNCIGRCNKEERLKIAPSDICSRTNSVSDGLPIRCVGEWAEQKIYLLSQYFRIFAQGMSKKWRGKINYVEICSGPGRCVNRNNRTEFNGTALSIVDRPEFKYINKALFFDNNEQVVAVLNQRLCALKLSNAKAYVGDYTDPQTICKILGTEINRDSLNLVVIDPTDCSVPFGFLEALKSTLPKLDLLINVAIGTDYNRNVMNTLLQPEQYRGAMRKYCSFLGDNNFYKTINVGCTYPELRAAFLKAYKKRLNIIGFSFFDEKSVENYYYIMFASQNRMGLDFWKKATRYDYIGQGSLF